MVFGKRWLNSEDNSNRDARRVQMARKPAGFPVTGRVDCPDARSAAVGREQAHQNLFWPGDVGHHVHCNLRDVGETLLPACRYFDSGYALRYLVECLHELIFRHAAGVSFQHRFALHHFFDHASSLALQRQRRSRQNCRDNCRVPDSGDHLVSPVQNGRIPRSRFIHNGWRREYLRRWR